MNVNKLAIFLSILLLLSVVSAQTTSEGFRSKIEKCIPRTGVAGILGLKTCKLVPNPLTRPLPVPDPIKKGKYCLQIYNPVCGIDGKTYGNECEAYVNGVEIAYKGECEPTKENICCKIFGYGEKMVQVDVKYERIPKEQCKIPLGFTGGGREIVDNIFCIQPPEKLVCCHFTTYTGITSYRITPERQCITTPDIVGIVDDSFCKIPPKDLICCQLTFDGIAAYDWIPKEKCVLTPDMIRPDMKVTAKPVDDSFCISPPPCPKDEKQCPGGSVVTRVLPRCDFLPCPPPPECIPKIRVWLGQSNSRDICIPDWLGKWLWSLGDYQPR